MALLTTIDGTNYDHIDIYYSTTATSSGHSVKVWADYRKTGGEVRLGY